MTTCQQCGSELAPASHFCAQCGAARPEPATPPAAEENTSPTGEPTASHTAGSPREAGPTVEGVADAPAPSAPTTAPLAAARTGTGSLDLDADTLKPAALGGLVAYGAALAASVVTMLVMFIGSVIQGDDGPSGSSDLSGADVNLGDILLSLPFQMVSLGSFGTLSLANGEDSLGHVWLPLFTVAPGLVLGAAFWARRTRRAGQSMGQTWTQAALAGLVAGALTWALAALFGLRTEDTWLGEFTLHAGSFTAFLGAFVLTGAGWVLGSLAHRSHEVRPRGAWAGALSTYGVHVAVVSVGLLLGLLVAVLKDNGLGWALIAFPVWPQVLLWGYQVVHFGSVTAGNETAGLWSEASGLVRTLWILLLLVALVVAGVRWWVVRDRRHTTLNSPAGWLALPAVFAGGALLMLLLTQVNAGMSFMGMSEAGRIAPTTTILLTAPLAGLAVELVSRFVAPHLVQYVPASLMGRWQAAAADSTTVDDPTPAATLAAPAPGAPAVADDATQAIPTPTAGDSGATAWHGETAPGSTDTTTSTAPLGAGAGAGTPMDPATKRRLTLGAMVLGGVVLALLVLSLLSKAVNSAFFAPEKQVEQYMEAVVDGRGSDAMRLADPNIPTDQRLLMVDEVYAEVENRPTGFEIGEVKKEDDRAVVPVKYTQNGVTESVDVAVERDGSSFVFFDKWKIADASPLTGHVDAYVPEGTEKVVVNGREVPTNARAESGFAVLPGTYRFSLPNSTYQQSSGEAVRTWGPAGQESSAGQDDGQLTYEPTPALEEEALKQAKAHLEECAKSTDAEPQGCPFSTYTSEDVRNGSWKIDQQPQMHLEAGDDWGQGGLRLTTDSSGRATYSYEEDTAIFDEPPTWEKKTDEVEFDLNGEVLVQGDEVSVTWQ
ncbi:hypothetical protein CYJ76_04270 [Kytococcus schroeteri]|uniref:Zinc-ribbon domain-containing protein n=1 Tax=Kytococcus schroeteri TaxID=138300 RepID=A0A2I1PBR1_9MICO|nr:zinc ribbon domain-containing protein [Kytococcus schroeteri]PKZ42069.1 hypothetical protein CYJ76_04270 [Kytococcus schroeteri]